MIQIFQRTGIKLFILIALISCGGGGNSSSMPEVQQTNSQNNNINQSSSTDSSTDSSSDSVSQNLAMTSETSSNFGEARFGESKFE